MSDADKTFPGNPRGKRRQTSQPPPPAVDVDLPMPLITDDLRDHVQELHQDMRLQTDLTAAHFVKISVRMDELNARSMAMGTDISWLKTTVTLSEQERNASAKRDRRIFGALLVLLSAAILTVLLLRMFRLIGV